MLAFKDLYSAVPEMKYITWYNIGNIPLPFIPYNILFLYFHSTGCSQCLCSLPCSRTRQGRVVSWSSVIWVVWCWFGCIAFAPSGCVGRFVRYAKRYDRITPISEWFWFKFPAIRNANKNNLYFNSRNPIQSRVNPLAFANLTIRGSQMAARTNNNAYVDDESWL